jgi:Transcriptional regulators
MLNPNSVIPLYVQLANSIEEKIVSGIYLPGDRIDTEQELSASNNISVITVRKAVSALVEKGLVERKQGKGTFVTKPRFERNMKNLHSFTEACRQMGVKAGGKLLKNLVVVPKKEITDRLLLPSGSQVVFLSRLRTMDGEPVVIEHSYFPMKYAFLLDKTFEDSSLFEYLSEHTQARVTSSEKRIELCRATASEAELLCVTKGENLLYVKSTTYDQNREPIYVGVQIINGKRYSLYFYEEKES